MLVLVRVLEKKSRPDLKQTQDLLRMLVLVRVLVCALEKTTHPGPVRIQDTNIKTIIQLAAALTAPALAGTHVLTCNYY